MYCHASIVLPSCARLALVGAAAGDAGPVLLLLLLSPFAGAGTWTSLPNTLWAKLCGAAAQLLLLRQMDVNRSCTLDQCGQRHAQVIA